MKELILKENNPDNYVVVHLDNGVSFIHDNKTGKNYFNQEAISEITGLTQGGVSARISRYKAEISNITNCNIALNVLNSTKPVLFYDFDVVTYVVYRSNKTEAIQMRNYISNSIDEKFNRDVGFNSPVVSLKQEEKEVFKYLHDKITYHTQKAFELLPNKDFNYHMDKADKYGMELRKRQLQLDNLNNCKKRYVRELGMNKKGLLTESGENRVFIPDGQSTLIEFNININLERGDINEL